MTVFKTFLKVLNKYRITLVIYTVFLIAFGGFTMQTSENNMSFEASKPDILIVNNDKETKITKNLVQYLSDNSNIVDIKDNEEARNDALFYRDVSYIIYIPENYGSDFLKGLNPTIEIKSTGDYESSYAEIMLERYVKVSNIYQKDINNEDELIDKINTTLSKQTEVETVSKLDTNNLSKSTFYYNFLSYSILAGAIYTICLVLSSFRERKIKDRTVISSMSYKKHNRILLVSNFLFAIVLWLAYILLSFILCGKIMFTMHGMIYILNSLVFTLCAVTIAFLFSSILNNKNAINGIVNVVALGSSFLCGAFVPAEFLPNSVLTIAHFLPSYWYIQTNEILKNLEVINLKTLEPILFNIGMLVVFCLIFIVINNVITKKKLRNN